MKKDQEIASGGAGRNNAFSGLIAIACIAAFVPGAYTLISVGGDGGDEARLAAAVVEILFAFLCLALVLQIKTKGDSAHGAEVFIVALAALSLFIAYLDGAALVWIVLFPQIATFALGRRRGAMVAAAVGLAVAAILLAIQDRASANPRDIMISLAVVYVVLAVFAWYSGRILDGERRGNAAFRQAQDGEQAGAVDDRSRDNLQASLDIANSEADEIVVLYRKESLETLAAIPDPSAVFTYILLEGMTELTGKGTDNGKRATIRTRTVGGYEFSTLGIDDMLSKVESVIDAREAKKMMEFNKIQAQIDAAKSREDGDDEDQSSFARVCFSYNLSEREAAVAKCVLKGMTNKETSTELFISVETVKTHVKNLFKKCDINSRIDFIKLFSRP